jgi:phosphatidate cytidylyltransferase
VLALLAALGAAEFYGLAAARGVRAFRATGAALAAATVAFAVANVTLADAAVWQWSTAVGVAMITAVASLHARGIEGAPLAASAITLFGALFVGGGLAFAVYLRNLATPPGADPVAGWTGAALVAWPIAVTWIGDTAAYFGGRRFGRHKLSPRISPKKTVEGAVAGFAASVLTGAMFGWLVFGEWLGTGPGVLACALGAALIAPAGQVGDLAEPLFKREAGVKDSGNLLPGHGGVLDRFDSIFLALPVAYFFLRALAAFGVEGPWP